MYTSHIIQTANNPRGYKMILAKIEYLLKTNKATRRADKNEYDILNAKYIKTFTDEQEAFDDMTIVRVCEKNKPQMSDNACRISVIDAKTGQIRDVRECVFFHRNGCGRVYCPCYPQMEKWVRARTERAVYTKALKYFWSDKVKTRGGK